MITELVSAVQDGRVDPVDLVTESLRRIEASNDTLNAVVRIHAEEALAEARAHSCTGALAGLPLLVKDMARCVGSRTTFGMVGYEDAPPDTIDDAAIGRLRAAGAIVIGRSNTPAFGHAPFTANALYGATTNPWNPERSPGGSSGGSGAALAAGLVPLATTSDGGGSVRIPASLCGLVGYKPTTGAVGRNILPRWIEFSTQGIAAHSVADVVAQAHVILGPAAGDWLSVPASTVSIEPMRPARIIACRTFRADVDAVIEAACEAALAALIADGAVIERSPAPSDVGTAFHWFNIATAELAQSLAGQRGEWETYEPSLQEQLGYGETVTAARYIESQRQRHVVGARFDELLGHDAVLVVPVSNVQSWGPRGPVPDFAGAVTGDPSIGLNTPDVNFTGHPAVSVPIGLDDSGVPFGLQVIAPRWADGLALGVAAWLERLLPWALVAPGYEPYPSGG